ncbi:MAG: peptidylprolyl isomerase, partial [Rhodanobacteraceae bacterium]
MSLTATFKTSQGPIRVRLFDDKAPLTVANFVNLAQRGYYD